MPHNDKQFRMPHVSLSEDEHSALQTVMGNIRHKTRKNLSYAELLKQHCFPKICAENGVQWPVPAKAEKTKAATR